MQPHLNRWRIAVHGLEIPRFADLHDAVSFFGAVQSQNTGPATWAMAQRIADVTAAGIAASLDRGLVIRTHVLRPTWHYVAAEDLRAWLALTGPRVRVQVGPQLRSLNLDSDVLERCQRVIATVLQGRSLTRAAVGEALANAGVDTDSLRLAAIVMHAELTGLVCSGAGAKQPTYALVDERIPSKRALDPDEALAELTLRYFTSHGPATLNDFRWWSSLKVGDIRQALAAVRDRLDEFEWDGRTYWAGEPAPSEVIQPPLVNLIEIYDEYLVGYQESRDVADPAGREATLGYVRGLPLAMILVDGEIAGRWRARRSGSKIDLEVHLLRRLGGDEMRELRRVADRYATFHGSTLRDIRAVDYT
jgi:hypothetical protein